MTKTRRNVAIGASLILAIPMVTLVSSFVVFPLLVYLLFAVIANFAPVALAIAAGLEKLGYYIDRSKLFDAWAYSAIIWVGCAFGISRWGDAGSTIGARNEPYLKILFYPYVFLYQYVIA